MTSKVWIVFIPAGDDGDAESVDAVYDNVQTAQQHVKRVWAGRVGGPYSVDTKLPEWLPPQWRTP